MGSGGFGNVGVVGTSEDFSSVSVTVWGTQLLADSLSCHLGSLGELLQVWCGEYN